MKPTVIVTSADPSFSYLSYVPIFAKSWNRISDARRLLAFVRPANSFSKLASFLAEHIEVEVFESHQGVDLGSQAKLSRLLMASDSRLELETVFIADLDMIQLTGARLKAVAHVEPMSLVKWGFDHPAYRIQADKGKWPMDGTMALGSLFQAIVNPNGLDTHELIESWATLDPIKRENPFETFANFSDESLLRHLAEAAAPFPISEIPRSAIEAKMLKGRIDRSSKFSLGTRRLIKSGKKFEAHGFRPFQPETNIGRAILDHIDLTAMEYADYCSELKDLLTMENPYFEIGRT